MAKILVVDDEKVMVKGIRFNLENEGYTAARPWTWPGPTTTTSLSWT